ncbi:MAG: hypothetical protein EA383_00145 [Spirochaetaceae bacterium]|nr:MAG: hypothetical protein EA383_00145 [Spirochaetaceae bacterium]
MTITRNQIQRMRSHARMRIDADLEDMILDQYGEEPDGPEYTDQDLHEQIRKLINQYNLEHPDPRFVDNPTPWARRSSTAAAPMKHRRYKNIQ